MKNAVIYARYSSDKQDEASIDAQVRACQEYAAGKGCNILEVYTDEAISGKGSKKPAGKPTSECSGMWIVVSSTPF